MSRKRHSEVGRSARAPGRSTKRKTKRKGRWRTAAASDKYELYELSVQEPQAECDLVDQVWKERRGRTPHHIREDFCGTAAVCFEWIKRRRTNTAIGVELDQGVLQRAEALSRKRLKGAQMKRLKLLRGDVRTIRTPPVDSVLAMNFSYFIFKTRQALRGYFKAARNALVKDGLFLLDAYGGSDSFSEIEEDRDFDGFTYIWDQNLYNPITGHVINHIHFEFPDGTKIKKAFSYDWRLWTLPEIQEVLLEAGFKHVWVYWEGTDKKTGEGDGIWKISTRGEACLAWIAYLVAEK